MVVRQFAAWALSLALLALVFPACSDSTSPTARPAILKGTITDQNGDPVVGAAILISFAPSFEDYLLPLVGKAAGMDLPPRPPLLSAKILDPCDNVVRTLCDGNCDEMQLISWNGRDDEGNRAVEGIYIFEIATADTVLRNDLVLIHRYDDWDLEEGNAHALTDANGQYRIEDKCLGFGTEITLTDEQGNFLDTRLVQRVIDIRIMAPDARFGQRDALLWPAESSVTLNYSFTASSPTP